MTGALPARQTSDVQVSHQQEQKGWYWVRVPNRQRVLTGVYGSVGMGCRWGDQVAGNPHRKYGADPYDWAEVALVSPFHEVH